MKKNITVIDAQGNEYEATYPKRAKGLVKNGRARFVNETTICLACPPHTEGIQMNMDEILKGAADTGNTPGTAETNTSGRQPDAAYIMQKIDQILSDTQYLKDAIASAERSGDIEALGMGIGNLVESREKTNQAMIALLEKMLDRVMPAPADSESQKLKMVIDFMANKNLNDESSVVDIANQIIQRIL